MEEANIKLTSFSKGSGCGCKVAPDVLKRILHSTEELPTPTSLLIGNEHSDDAAVLQINDQECLISTTDFFTPIVDDPYDYGKIAATNALSDVYAMGGKPVLALAVLAWPTDKLSPEIASRVLEGARFICRMAGIALAGGHTIESTEPIFGLAVNGLIHPKHIKRNNTPKEGDLLFLTKPLGSGIFSAALKKNLLDSNDYDTMLRYMCRLNDVGSALGELKGVSAMTDITGFGLLGHLAEMRGENKLSARIYFDRMPLYPGLQKYLDQFVYPDITTKNFNAISSMTSTLNATQLFTLCDPQTSGGLLVSLQPDEFEMYRQIIQDYNLGDFALTPIGEWSNSGSKPIEIL